MFPSMCTNNQIDNRIKKESLDSSQGSPIRTPVMSDILLVNDNNRKSNLFGSQVSDNVSSVVSAFPGCALLSAGYPLTKKISIDDELGKPCLSCSLHGANCPRFAGGFGPAIAAGPAAGPAAAGSVLCSIPVALHHDFSTTSNGENPRDDATTVAKIVGFHKLRQLLAPVHPYFADKKAHILRFNQFKRKIDADEEQAPLFLYPVVKGDDALAHRMNPYRKYRLARSHTGRLVSEIEACYKANGLDDGRMVEIIQTVPADVSQALSKMPNGKELMWKAYKKFWDKLPDILGIDGVLGTETNLHIWKTEEPVTPHFHFHSLTFNYYVKYLPEKMNKAQQIARAGEYEPEYHKWFGEGILKQRVSADDAVQNGYFPFSSLEMDTLKQVWTDIIRKMCLKNHIDCEYFNDCDVSLDVNVSFFSLDDTTRLASRLNYQRRHWIEDYALYTLKQPGCENPPAWLEGYNNRARCFGWWLWLSLLGGIESEDIEPKRDYETGEELISAGECTSFAGLDLWSLETIKGRAVIQRLTDSDKTWLAVCLLDGI